MLTRSCSIREKEGAVDQRRSFSFSSLDFNSSFGPLSTDEEEEEEEEESAVDHQGIYSEGDDNDDAYIEIDLDHPPAAAELQSENDDRIVEKEIKEDDDNDLEFRVSFLEAALPFIGLSSPRSSSYSTLLAWPPPHKRKVPLFLPVNHLVSTLESSPPPIADDHCRNSAICKTDSKQLVLSMNRLKVDGDVMERGMTNMMVKFRYVMSFRWMVASMWKIRRQQRQAVASSAPPPPPPSSSSTPAHFSSRSSQRAKAGADSSSSRNQKQSNRLLIRRTKQHSNGPDKSRSSVVLLRRLGIKLDAIRGLLSSDHGGGKHSKSCPSSIKSSPLHHQGGGGAAITSTPSGTLVYSRDNSVQAAIAHCKKSFGRSEDFSF